MKDSAPSDGLSPNETFTLHTDRTLYTLTASTLLGDKRRDGAESFIGMS